MSMKTFANGTLSTAIYPTTSVTQGDGSAGDHARNYLYDTLDYLHEHHKPTTIDEFVDDLDFAAEGEPAAAEYDLTEAAVELGLKDLLL